MLTYLRFTQDIKLVELIDIFTISIFIYLLLVWLKKARARLVLLGMVIVGSIYILARIFHLYLTTMVFQAFFTVFIILIIVIFQDDIRSFFERIAVWGITRRSHHKIASAESSDIISDSLANLSRRHIGALVVLWGRDPLDRYLEAGINLGGSLSRILLESLFEPHAPSHDGAVIIDGDKIVKFGCHLPLSKNIAAAGNLGTRHAAALGLAEQTDALCIVVSEESGDVSIAEGGRIRRISNIGDFHGIIKSFYRKRFPEKNKSILGEFVTEHFLEKIIAIILACGLWFVFGHRPEIIRRDFVIPIEYRNLSADHIIGEPKPKEVTVTLSGSERSFSLIEPKDIKVSLDMESVIEGENKFTVTKDLLRLPSGLSLINAEPDELAFKVYKLVNLNVPVAVKTQGRLPSNVTLGPVKVEPAEIAIIIPSTIPKDKISVTTEPIDLKNISETVTLTPQLIFNPEIRFPGGKPPEVKVTIEIENKQ
jgi:diadenylate cyclase